MSKHRAAMVQGEAHPAPQPGDGGAQPTSPLQSLRVAPIPIAVAKEIVTKHHYLHSLPGGTLLAFGVFSGSRLLGALTLGVGPFNAHRLVDGASPDDCLVLSRLWLNDELPPNSESRVLGIVLRALKAHTQLKFVLSYADPAQNHVGTIYQAAGWVYTGLSEGMPLYDLGDGKAQHSRSLSHAYGSHSVRHFEASGVPITLIPQAPKHRYFRFLDPAWRSRLRIPILPYPKREAPP